jgi:autoaggregation protein RapA/B/C
MANHKPVAGDYFISGYDIASAIEDNILAATALEDIDGDTVRLNFVNGQRINRSDDPDRPATTIIEGKHGTLTIDQNGNFSYRLDPTDPDVLALGPGEQLLEQFTFKISDGLGATDFGVMDLVIDVPETGTYSIDFEDAGREFPFTYKGFEWGLLMDGDELPLLHEADGNTAVQSGAFTTYFLTLDGRDVEIRDLVVANHNWDESEVTFTGYLDGNEVGSQTLTVFGDQLSTGQHVSLSGFGLVDQIRVAFTPTDFDFDPTVEQPKLKFDDFLVVA